MKIINTTLKFKLLLALTLTSLIFSISGCQLIAPGTQQKSDELSRYYLNVKSFSTEEITQEIDFLKASENSASLHTQLKLTLLYSLPASPIHNPYTAKSQLNGMQLAIEQSLTLTPADFAFITLLKDQLNQQILLLNKLQKHKQDTALAKDAQQELNTKIMNLNEKVTLLTKQISQLQKIEQAISKRDEP